MLRKNSMEIIQDNLFEKFEELKPDAHERIYEKLMRCEHIDKADIQALGMFNDDWIDKLMSAGQKTVRAKMVEALTREGIEVRA